MSVAYLRFELRRTLRNRRVLLFSLAFPIVLYVLIAAPNRNEHDLAGTGISAPLYFMIGLASFGTMNAVLSGGARIAAERSVGWNRQLRITPLTARQYFRAKVATSYLLTADSVGPAIGGTTALFAFLGGSWFPITGNGFIAHLARDVPSYWVVQASRAGLGAPHPWTSHAWAVIVAWSVVLIAAARRAYRRDTQRV